MVQLIKKGGLRERSNRSKKYAQSENNIKTLDPHRYTEHSQTAEQNRPNESVEHQNTQINQ